MAGENAPICAQCNHAMVLVRVEQRAFQADVSKFVCAHCGLIDKTDRRINAIQKYRPLCSKCNSLMVQAAHAPAGQYTFECTMCAATEAVKFAP